MSDSLTNGSEFLFIALIIGLVTRISLGFTKIPYTILLFIFGVILGVIYHFWEYSIYYTSELPLFNQFLVHG